MDKQRLLAIALSVTLVMGLSAWGASKSLAPWADAVKNTGNPPIAEKWGRTDETQHTDITFSSADPGDVSGIVHSSGGGNCVQLGRTDGKSLFDSLN